MRLADVDRTTVDTFLRCLHDEKPDDARVIELRKAWFDKMKERGLRARVLILDSGEVAALCQYLPIEETSLLGSDMLCISCMWVHGYDHHIGNRQGNGYGRLMLEAIEEDARGSGASGVVAWGMDFPYWNPVSFYEHMGYERADKEGEAVLVWKPFDESAEAPAFRKTVKRPESREDSVCVTVFFNGSCTGSCEECVKARDAIEGLSELVHYSEYDTSDTEVLDEWGISMGIFVDGKPHRPHEPPCTSEELRRDILETAEAKGLR